MAHSWLDERQSTQWIGLLFNTGVHVIMYKYYYERSRDRIPAWKNWVTYSQIVQFGVSLFVVLPLFMHAQYSDLLPGAAGPSPSIFERALRWLGHYDNGASMYGQCAGAPALWRNVAFNVVLLVGFIGVLRTNKVKKPKKE